MAAAYDDRLARTENGLPNISSGLIAYSTLVVISREGDRNRVLATG